MKNKLQECFEEENGNEIWCSAHKDEEFPCLSLLTNKNGAVLNYFSENNEKQFVSIGDSEKDGVEELLGGQYEVE